MGKIESFEGSEAWKSARELTNEVYQLCRRKPLATDFGLCDQIRRAAVTVMNNLAEGWESPHAAEKQQAYNYARRSCGEVRSLTYVLMDNAFIDANEHASLLTLSIRTGQLVSGLIRSLNRPQ